ncbi:MAG: DUF4328 domain-containing protein [Planctomycetes bacterium]|nr:DUF4328 domain-containing protein [Planctomycetota bacterium]
MRDLRGLTRAVVWGVIACCGAQVLAIGFALELVGRTEAVHSGPGGDEFATVRTLDRAVLGEIEARRELAGDAALALFLATSILFLAWLWRAKANCRDRGPAGQEFSPGWAVGVWIVPFVNLYRPAQVLHETLDISRVMADPELRVEVHPARTLLRTWWLLTWMAGAAALLRSVFRFGSMDRGAVVVNAVMDAISGVLFVSAAIAFAILVVGIQRLQTKVRTR